jgi:methylmalonyl-CoA mutase
MLCAYHIIDKSETPFMTQETNLSLGNDFPDANKKDWLDAVEKALRGAAYESLQSRHNGLSREPLYTNETVKLSKSAHGMPGQAPFLRGSQSLSNSFLPWQIASRFTPGRKGNSNEDVLTDLEGGVSALLLECRFDDVTPTHLDKLLQGVDLNIAPVFLRAEDNAINLALHLTSKVGEETSLYLDLDPLGYAAASGLKIDDDIDKIFPGMAGLISQTQSSKNIRLMTASGVPYHNAGADAITELATIIATATHYMRYLEQSGLDVIDILTRLTLTVSSDTDFFGSIAKLRALRLLWGNVCAALQQDKIVPPFIHSEGSERYFSLADPWVNMLRATMSTLAAGIGGADVVTALPCTSIAESDNLLTRRVARNTQVILQEESHIGQVMDPAGGSWYVESLSEELASDSWSLFQDIEKAGGIASLEGMRIISSRIEDNQISENKDVAKRKMPVLGAGDFANLEEALLKPRPAYGSGILRETRPASAFEQLRFAAETHKPKVYLAVIGETAEFTARSNFVTNLFAAGGIESHLGCGGSDLTKIIDDFTTSGFSVAAICGTDAAYEEHADTLAQSLAEAGCAHVWLAGKYESNAINGNIFMGCDTISILQLTLSLSGISFKEGQS